MVSKDDFDPGLYTMLQKAFAARDEIKDYDDEDGVDHIYGFYSKSDVVTAQDRFVTREEQELSLFFKYLLKATRGHTVTLQDWGDHDFPKMVTSFPKIWYRPPEDAEFSRRYWIKHEGGERQIKRPPIPELWKEFYHAEPPDYTDAKLAQVEKRVYIHANTSYSVTQIARFLSDWITEIEGFVKFKVSGPGKMNRLDSIVAYLLDNKPA